MILDLLHGDYSSSVVVPPAWTPAELFKNNETGFWLDANDISTLFQDSNGTTPVTASTQAVGKWVSKISSPLDMSMTQATAANRPQYLEGTKGKYLRLDAVNDHMRFYHSSALSLTNGLTWAVSLINVGTGLGFVTGLPTALELASINIVTGVVAEGMIMYGTLDHSGAMNIGTYADPRVNSIVAQAKNGTTIDVMLNGVSEFGSTGVMGDIPGGTYYQFGRASGAAAVGANQIVMINRLLTVNERNSLDEFLFNQYQ